MTPRQRLALRALTTAAVLEALTWTGLLVGMWFKYAPAPPEATEAGVHLFGPLHGAAFVLYLVATAAAARALRWHWTTLVAALAASIPPLGTVVFEAWAARTGRLVPATAPTRAAAATAAR